MSDPFAPPGSRRQSAWARPAHTGTHVRPRLLRLLVALWCFGTAALHVFIASQALGPRGTWLYWRDPWSVPFALGMVGAALASVYASFSRDTRPGDRWFWASIAVAGLAVVLEDVVWPW